MLATQPKPREVLEHRAVEPGERVGEHRRAGRRGRPAPELEALLVRRPGEALGERALVLGEHVDREHRAGRLQQLVREVAMVDHHRHQRRLGRDRGERRDGEAVQRRTRADGDDRDASRRVAERVAEGRRLDRHARRQRASTRQ